MHDGANLLTRACQRFDEINAQDPREEEDADGRRMPKELLYGRRMSEALQRLAPDASEALALAVRAQHIARWRLARSDFPEGRKGYHLWRTRLMDMHADLASKVLRDVGYDEAMAERVGQLIRKRALKRDPEAQTLEDVACLVFLEHYFDGFAAKHSDDQVVDILRKTWGKMSPRGREAAMALELGERAKDLIGRALSA